MFLTKVFEGLKPLLWLFHLFQVDRKIKYRHTKRGKQKRKKNLGKKYKGKTKQI